MITKTKINKRKRKKTNPEIVKTAELAKKNNHLELAKKLTMPKRLYKKINLEELNKLESKKVLIVGKVLGVGEINKKIDVSALGFSKQAKEKLEKNKSKTNTILQELEQDPKLEGVKII